MLNSKVQSQRVVEPAVPEIRGQRGSSSQYAGTPVDGAVIFRHLRDAVGDSRTPESACDFVWQGTDGEILMPHESPEIGGGKAKC